MNLPDWKARIDETNPSDIGDIAAEDVDSYVSEVEQMKAKIRKEKMGK